MTAEGQPSARGSAALEGSARPGSRG